ncbi:MAG: outer membrane beta-barrel protein [bacterium]|nr:outer membrane beta-barrel protein [Candidatus Kapabacteria bacterium]
MKNALLILLTLVVVHGAVNAQPTNAPVTPKSASGDFGLLFDLGGLANLALNGFNGPGGDTSDFGAGFGAKYFIADNVAIRLAIALRSLSTDKPVGADPTEFVDKFSSFSTAITPSVTYNVVKSGGVAGYIGGQLSFGTRSSSSTFADTSRAKTDASMSSIGVGAIIGAEWFPWSNISLSGEYVLGFATSSTESDIQTGSAPSVHFKGDTETAIGVYSRGVLTAAMYW